MACGRERANKEQIHAPTPEEGVGRRHAGAREGAKDLDHALRGGARPEGRAGTAAAGGRARARSCSAFAAASRRRMGQAGRGRAGSGLFSLERSAHHRTEAGGHKTVKQKNKDMDMGACMEQSQFT